MKTVCLILSFILMLICCGCNSSENTVDKYLPSDMTFAETDVDFIGRFKQTDGGYQFSWSGSTIRAGFVGTEISATLELIEKYQQTDFLEVIIDGETQSTLELYPNSRRSIVLAEGLEYGYHTVELIKRTEQLSLMAFYGFDYGDSLPAPAPARKERRIEVIGDSITSGYGVMRMDGSRGFYSSEQDVLHTYGWLVAKSLDAEAVILGISSGGIVKNPVSERWNTYGGTVINEPYTTPAENIPDLVIVNLGTIDNHGGIKDDDFEIGYTRFIKELRTVYPDCYILCTVGGITNEPYNVISKVVSEQNAKGDSRIFSYKIIASRDGENMCGGDFHPNANGHAAMAEELTVFIKNTLNW